MKLLIVQHAEHEHAGRFRALLNEAGVSSTVVLAPQTGPQEWPERDAFDALWVLGGAMQVWETETYPWLADEIAFIRRAVSDWRKPYLGICFGHQLLACALGGQVGPAGSVEFGIDQVVRRDLYDPLLDGLPLSFATFQWHGAEVQVAPQQGSTTAFSTLCATQSVYLPGAVAGVQFHPEVDVDTMRDWYDSPGCLAALEALRGEGAAAEVLEQLARHEGEMSKVARKLFGNWMALAREHLAAPALTSA